MLIEIFEQWIHHSHESLIPFKAEENSQEKKLTLLKLPSVTDSQVANDPAKERSHTVAVRNKRNLDVFVSTGESFMNCLEEFLQML